MGALLGRALAEILLPLLQPLELVGDLLPLVLVLLPLGEELFFCVHHFSSNVKTTVTRNRVTVVVLLWDSCQRQRKGEPLVRSEATQRLGFQPLSSAGRTYSPRENIEVRPSGIKDIPVYLIAKPPNPHNQMCHSHGADFLLRSISEKHLSFDKGSGD